MLEDAEQEIDNILRSQRVGYLCTSNGKNTPHATPIFFLYNFGSNEVVFLTDRRSKKLANLLENENVAFMADIRDAQNPFNNRGVMVKGKVTKITDLSLELSDKMKKLLDFFACKYEDVLSTEPEPRGAAGGPPRRLFWKKFDLDDYALSEKGKLTPREAYYYLVKKEYADKEIVKSFQDVLVTVKAKEIIYWKGPFSKVVRL